MKKEEKGIEEGERGEGRKEEGKKMLFVTIS